MQKRHCQSRRRGFTFVELMIGMMVTGLVLCALTVFTFGVGASWMQSDSAQSAFLTETMAVERLSHILREAQQIESNPTPGSLNASMPAAACMLWADQNLPDGKIQYCEMTMLEYIPSSQTLVQWSIPAGANNALTVTQSLLSEQQFRLLQNRISTVLADNVLGCQFFAQQGTSGGPLPSLEVILKIQTGNPAVPSQVVYTTVALRAPNLNPQYP